MARANGADNKRKKQLTLREQRFVEAMADPRTKSNTQAAIQAGYAPQNARIIAAQNLTKLNISDAIRHRKQRALEHAEVSAQEVLGSAVFQMRSSMADVLDDEGSFDLNKAVDTGAIDLLKKHKETTRTIYDKEGGCEVIKTVEVEMLTNQDARKDVANYIGLERFAPPPRQSTIEKFVRVARTVAAQDGITVEEVYQILVDYNRIPEELKEDVRLALIGG